MPTSAEAIVLPRDDSTTALVSKAVAVINSEKQSTSDKAPQTQELSSIAHSGTDSGYGSLVSSPAETSPEVVASKFTVCAGTDGGSRRRLFPIRKDQLLRPFDKPIQQEIQKRFNDLNDLYNDALVEFLVKSKVDTRNISIKLKHMGYKEETAKPFVIILCPKAACKKVKQFFGEQAVKSQYQPQQPSVDLPYLEIQVIPRPPRLIASAVSVCAPHRDITLDFPALYGAPVKVNRGERSRFGSLGGMIMATRYSGSTTFYLMSAGHIFNPEHQGSEENDREPSSDGTDEDSLEEQSDVDVFDVEVTFEQHRDKNAEHCTQDIERAVKLSSLDWPEMDGTWTTSTSINGREGRPNLDWALATIDSFEHYDPRYLIDEDLDGVLQKGDCGSWVIDIESGEVFGHVVAADDFGEAYVIPFDSTTKEMSVDLGMDLVTIPTIKDIRIWCLTRRLQERKLYQNEIFPLIEEFTPPPDSGYSSLQSSPNF
ncbi:MAG: hypothetical protein MMC33_005082 [Icmadophila ericetorum]|nr:hypothetical protein [Icmadophila ericetorum]